MNAGTDCLLNIFVLMNKIQVKRKKEKIERKEISDFEKTWIHNIWIWMDSKTKLINAKEYSQRNR